MAQNFFDIFDAGGWVMIPLLGLSVISVGCAIERAWFWVSNDNRTEWLRIARVSAALRRGDLPTAVDASRKGRSVYIRFARGISAELDELRRVGKVNSPLAVGSKAFELIEQLQPRIERHAVILSTTITAAPMLGILGTVLGIIKSFDILSSAEATRDPALVADGIASALLTTAAGLIIALLALFPYMVFRTKADRCITRLETLAAAAEGYSEAVSAMSKTPST